MMLFLVLVARLAADDLVPLRMAESFLAMHRAAAVGGAIGVAALGLVLFIIAPIELALQSGQAPRRWTGLPLGRRFRSKSFASRRNLPTAVPLADSLESPSTLKFRTPGPSRR